MQTTILEWLEMLPDGYREICKAEYDPDFGTYRDAVYLKEAVSNLCNWRLSKIKDNFLYDLYASIGDDNIFNFAKLPPLPENWQDLYKDKLQEETIKIKKPKNPNKKRNKLAIKIYLKWLGEENSEHCTFELAMKLAEQIIYKLKQ